MVSERARGDTDVVTRLRHRARWDVDGDTAALMREAAAEVERLRAAAGGASQRTEPRCVLKGWAQWVDDENWLFAITDEPSMAQEPATLTIEPDVGNDD